MDHAIVILSGRFLAVGECKQWKDTPTCSFTVEVGEDSVAVYSVNAFGAFLVAKVSEARPGTPITITGRLKSTRSRTSDRTFLDISADRIALGAAPAGQCHQEQYDEILPDDSTKSEEQSFLF